MKFLLFLVLIVGLGGGYAYWPYSTTSKLRDFVDSSDALAVDKVIDWGSYRSAVHDQVKPLVDDSMRKRFPVNYRQVTSIVSTEDVLNKMLDQEMNGKGLIRSIKGGQDFSEAKPVGIEARTWDGFSGFELKLAGSEARYHFDLKGLDGWKLVNARLGSKDIDVYVGKFHQVLDERLKQIQTTGGSGVMKALQPGTPQHESWLKDYVNPLDARPPSATGRSGRGGR